MLQERISLAIAEQLALLEKTFEEHSGELGRLVERLVETFDQGGKLLVAGNGSLGPVANQTANLFLHRLSMARPMLPAHSLCQDLTLLGSLARFGEQTQVFSRQLRTLATSDDLLLVLADDHRDETIEELLNAARQIGCPVALFSNAPREGLDDSPDFDFPIRTSSPVRMQELSQFFGNLLCSLVEGELFGI